MPKIEISEIKRVATQALTRHGATFGIAASVADAVGLAEARGNRICGLYYLECYCQQLETGRVKGDVAAEVSRPKPGLVKVDAKFGFAQPAFAAGLSKALEAARENGTVTLAVGHAHTCTSLGYFTEQIAGAGFIGIGMTNASPIVAGPGGKKRIIGTNPIACSVPDGRGGIAMQFDFSTSAVALGKITMAKAAGNKIPLGWAVDADGNPTEDPEAALGGALVSAGGHKGWGFGLMAEILTAGLAGGVNSVDVKPLKAPQGPPHDLGQVYIIIDPGVAPDFYDRLAGLQAALEDDAARLPGSSLETPEAVEVEGKIWDLALKLSG